MDNAVYSSWLRERSLSEDDLAGMRYQQRGFGFRPLFTICVLVSDLDEIWIKNTLDSVLKQVYTNIELLALDNGCERLHVSQVLSEYSVYDTRVKCMKTDEMQTRSEALESVANQASGDFLTFVDAGDILAPEYVFAMVESMQHASFDILYCDEDEIDITDVRSAPKFKPYWSPDLLFNEFYVGRSFAITSTLLKRAGCFTKENELVEEYGMLLRASEQTASVFHVARVMYSRRNLPSQSGSESDFGHKSRSSVEPITDENINRATSVSIILIPSTDGSASIWPGFRNIACPPNVSVEILTTGSQDIMLERGAKHVAGVLNSVAKRATGEELIFVNESIKVIDYQKWLAKLLQKVDGTSVGGVCCKVTSSQGELRFGGTLPGLKNLIGFDIESSVSYESLLVSAESPFNPCVLNPYCFAIRREVFERIGGFDEENCPSAFYTLDLSRKLGDIGFLNVYVPDETIICDDSDPLPTEAETSYIWRTMWRDIVDVEYYTYTPFEQTVQKR